MSSVCERAACASLASTFTGARPLTARASLIARTSDESVVELSRAHAASAVNSSNRPAMRGTRRGYLIEKRSILPDASDGCITPVTSSARRLCKHDSAKRERSSRDLRTLKGLSEPSPGDGDRNGGLEHRDDRDARCADVTQRTDHEHERDDCPEHDDRGDEQPERRVPGAQATEEHRVALETPSGEAPPRKDDRPEQRRE